MVLPEPRDLDPAELRQAYDWPSRPWLRTCLVMSLDGCIAGPDGLSGSISGRADRAVLAAVRAMADAYLVGAQTLRAEGYGAVRSRPELRGARRARGQRPAPTLAIVSGSCRFDWGRSDFTESDEAPIVLTSAASDPTDRRAAAAAGCQVLIAGESQVDLPVALAALRDRGLPRVTAEGGPALVDQLIRADLVDEVALTLSPRIVAGARGPGGGPAVLTRMQLAQVLEDEGFLFTRYVRPEAETC